MVVNAKNVSIRQYPRRLYWDARLVHARGSIRSATATASYAAPRAEHLTQFVAVVGRSGSDIGETFVSTELAGGSGFRDRQLPITLLSVFAVTALFIFSRDVHMLRQNRASRAYDAPRNLPRSPGASRKATVVSGDNGTERAHSC